MELRKSKLYVHMQELFTFHRFGCMRCAGRPFSDVSLDRKNIGQISLLRIEHYCDGILIKYRKKGLQRSSISKIYCQWDKIWFCWNCYFLSRFLPFCLKRLVTIFQISDETLLAGQIKGFHVAYAKLFEGTILIFW